MRRRFLSGAVAAVLLISVLAVSPVAAARTGFANASCAVVGATFSVNVDAYGIDAAPRAYLGTSRHRFSTTGTTISNAVSYDTYVWFGVVLVPGADDRFVKVTGRFGGTAKEKILACR